MRPILSVAEMREADAAAQAQVGIDALVERAGLTLARSARRQMGGTYGRRVAVVAGPGHNGDDGRVAAAWLGRWGARVMVLPAAGREQLPPQVPDCDLVIDAAYGTGFRGEYQAPWVPRGAGVLSVDIPTGVDGDTGGGCAGAVAAQATVTFGALKPGLLIGDGPSRSGVIEVADIGLDVSRAAAHLVEDRDVGDVLPARPRQAHKWQSALYVAAGSPGMLGSASLCSTAAMRAGAGMVRLGVPGASPSDLPVSEVVASALPELGWQDQVLEALPRCHGLVVGPGLGTSDVTASAVRKLVASAAVPTLLDADALNVVGSVEELATLVTQRVASGTVAPVVVTPHDGEYSRLVGRPPGPDRFAAARSLAAGSGAVVVLKGSTTIVAAPDGRALVSTAGSPRLATAGTGDVLSGVVGAFLAQGVGALEAAALAAHVHGRAAGLGMARGLVAGDLLELLATYLSGLSGEAP
ncbi:MAG: NAD(P)H-hydrate dehydratase [Acidimicrobiales bacterium]